MVEEIKKIPDHKVMIRKRNNLFIVMCALLYATTYMLKLGYGANINQFESLFALSHSQTGLVSTVFFISYGSGQFLSAFLCKKYNLRKIIPLALIISAIINICFGSIPSFAPFVYLSIVNGVILASIFPSMTRAIAENVDYKFKARSVVAVMVTCRVGTLLTYAFSSLFTYIGFFRLYFILAACIGLSSAIGWYLLFPKAKRYEEDEYAPEINKEKTKKEKKISKLVGPFLLTTIVLAIFSVFDAVVRDGLLTWFPTILKEQYDFPEAKATIYTIFLTLGQIAGSCFAVWLDKKLKNCILDCLILFVIGAIFLAINYFIKLSTPWLMLMCFIISIFAFSGITTVICSIYPIYIKKLRNSGLIGGILKGSGYVGSAIASYVLGTIADIYGWDLVFVIFLLIAFSIFGIALIYYLYIIISNKKKDKCHKENNNVNKT